MPRVISFKGSYKLISTITGTTTNREFNFQLMTNSKGFGTDIPFGSFGDALKHLQDDISTCQRIKHNLSGNLYVEADQIDDKNSSSNSQSFTIKSIEDLAKLHDFMMSKRTVGLDASAPQPEVMDDLKQPFLPSKSLEKTRLEDESNSDDCCSYIKHVLRYPT